ncbi:MAG: YncE family protein, partial [Alphaproteobacteria bacterium]|nr:YncE family protein [Alphaproteobacteria bacterium]
MIPAIRVTGAAILAALCMSGAARADIAAITSQTAGMLTLIDTDTGAILTITPLPGNPAAVAIDAVRGRIMAVAVDTGLLHVFDMTGQPLAQHKIAGAPFGLAIRPETGTALVTDQTGTLKEINPDTGAEVASWPVGAMPSGVAAAPGLIVTADRDADAVTVIRGDEATTWPVGQHPFGVTLHDGLIFTADVLDDTVSVLDPVSGTILATIPTGERPYAVAFAAGHGFVTNQ